MQPGLQRSTLEDNEQVVYKFYEDYGTSRNKGGVVMSFTPDAKMSPDEYFNVSVLPPFAKFVPKDESSACVVSPPVADFKTEIFFEWSLMVRGSFQPNQRYLVSCPDIKVTLPLGQGNYALASGGKYQDGLSYQTEATKIKFTSAESVATLFGSIVLAAIAALLE